MTTFSASWQPGGDRAPLREEPTPSRERRRSCACAYERAPLSAGESHVPKSPGGLLDHGESGGSGTLSRRWRHRGATRCACYRQPWAHRNRVSGFLVGTKGYIARGMTSFKNIRWRESARSAVFRSRWTRSTREVNTKEIESVDENGAAVAKIVKSRFLEVVSRQPS